MKLLLLVALSLTLGCAHVGVEKKSDDEPMPIHWIVT
jgi:hypothetical protein